MKNINLMVIIMTIFFVIPAFAGVTLPVGSKDRLREYALDKVVRGYRDVVSASMMPIEGQPTWVEATGSGAEEVIDELLKKQIVFETSNPNDPVWGRIWLYDEEWNCLFFGSTEYVPALLGKAGPVYNIWMQGVPLPVEGVVSAEVLVLGKDGKTAGKEGLVIRNGKPVFHEWMAGAQNGVLVVKQEDGTLVKFDLWDPIVSTVNTVAESGVTWKLGGHHIIPCPEGPIFVNLIEVWDLPTALIEVRSGQVVFFDVQGMVNLNGQTVFERPYSVHFTEAGGGTSLEAFLSEEQPTSIMGIPPGKYRVRFEWRNFGKPGRIYLGPSDGKG